jgi:tRNA(Ile)-lysidine synthase TilS/MesJ
MQKAIGILCVVIGVLLLVWGHNMAQSISGQLQNVFTGSPGNKPMYLYIGGTVLEILGVAQIFWPAKRR